MLRPPGHHFDAHTLRRAPSPCVRTSRGKTSRSRRGSLSSVEMLARTHGCQCRRAPGRTCSSGFVRSCSCSCSSSRRGSNASPKPRKKGSRLRAQRASLSLGAAASSFPSGKHSRAERLLEWPTRTKGPGLDDCCPRPPDGGGELERGRRKRHRQTKRSSRGSLLLSGRVSAEKRRGEVLHQERQKDEAVRKTLWKGQGPDERGTDETGVRVTGAEPANGSDDVASAAPPSLTAPTLPAAVDAPRSVGLDAQSAARARASLDYRTFGLNGWARMTWQAPGTHAEKHTASHFEEPCDR
jgi:hypothetical protein